MKNGWKKFEEQKTDEDRGDQPRDETKSKFCSDLFYHIRDHFDPFDGALRGFKILSGIRTDIISPARQHAALYFVTVYWTGHVRQITGNRRTL